MPLPYFYAATDVGLHRQNNEDSILGNPGNRLWLVADGMGGHASGEVASDIVSKTIDQAISEGLALPEAVQKAHQCVVDAASNDKGHLGMGSTVVALRSNGNQYQIAWVGDSRAYLWSKGETGETFEQLTVDHSYVQMLYQSGAISEREMTTHPDKNVITQCLGSLDIERVKVDLVEREWQKEDRILLCSDGLTDTVDNQTLCNLLSEHEKIDQCVDAMIQTALSNGGYDNVSVVLISKPPSPFRRVLSSLL